MNDESDNKDSIDAVITWVDGKDPVHQKKRMRAMDKDVPDRSPLSLVRIDDTRFLDNGELRFCIASIRKFAPWIRNIYLVTDEQVPAFLTPEVQRRQRVRLVNHSEIFAGHEWALPTFNSRTIETALWRIPGLADRFIYFNDDFVLTAPVQPGDFFHGESVVARGRWQRMASYGHFRLFVNLMVNYLAKAVLGITRTMHLLLQIRSAQLAGFTRTYFRVEHVPHPVHKPVLQSFFNENQELFERNIQYRFRDTAQFSAIYLGYHLKMDRSEAVIRKPDDVLMVHGEMDPRRRLERKIRKIERQEVRFVSLQGLERMDERQRKRLEEMLVDVTGLDF
ncbi:MAG: stealth family protein [Cyclonatronaceae bacterium]